MKVGLFLICHAGIAEALLNTAIEILGEPPLLVKILPVPSDSNKDDIQQQAEQVVSHMGRQQDILILTDLVGSTPNNIALSLRQQGHVSVISGLNVPMLLKVFTYPQLSLQELSKKACDGAKNSIVQPIT